jgi:murein DD-endopeptidase MepM/ murein hydrolase activator NlpD
MDSAKEYHQQGWCIPDTTHLFTASWVEHSAHVLSVKEPSYPIEKKFPLFYGGFISYSIPCTGKKTSGFGLRWEKNHYGIDLSGNKGDAIYSSFDGVVRYAKYNKGGYGNLIVIRHFNGLETYYAHLSNINVKTGQRIKAGDEIGEMGNTGHSFGDHLHFEVRILGYPINPELLFDFIHQKILFKSYHISKKGIEFGTNQNCFCIQEKCLRKETKKVSVTQEKKDTIIQEQRKDRRFGNM